MLLSTSCSGSLCCDVERSEFEEQIHSADDHVNSKSGTVYGSCRGLVPRIFYSGNEVAMLLRHTGRR